MAGKKVSRWRQRWLWQKIRTARSHAELARERFDKISGGDVDDEGRFQMTPEMAGAASDWERADQAYRVLVQRRLINTARRWGVPVPYRSDKKHWLGGYPLLTEFGTFSIRSQLFQKRVAFWGLIFAIFFGLFTIIQTGYTVAEYYKGQQPTVECSQTGPSAKPESSVN